MMCDYKITQGTFRLLLLVSIKDFLAHNGMKDILKISFAIERKIDMRSADTKIEWKFQ